MTTVQKTEMTVPALLYRKDLDGSKDGGCDHVICTAEQKISKGCFRLEMLKWYLYTLIFIYLFTGLVS